MEAFKSGIHLIIQMVLWAAFFFYLNDPIVFGPRPDGNVYAGFTFLIDMVYRFADVFLGPIQLVMNISGLSHLFPPTIFPVLSAPSLHQALSQPFMEINNTSMIQMINQHFPPTMYGGAVVLWIPIASTVYYIIYKSIDTVVGKVRNWAWVMLVEYAFQRRKATVMEHTLSQKTQDLDRMNAQIYALAQETNSLKDSVITDELTKVYNKRFFLDRLSQEFGACRQQGQYFCLVMVDIDFFKRLNDNYGHMAGDEVLKQVATVLKRFTPDLCYACRFGGEEFGIILPRKTVQEATECTRSIQEQLQKLRFPNIDPNLRITISQGICAVDFGYAEAEQIKSYDDVLQLADQQLYRSKTNGRNRVSTIAIVRPSQPQAQSAN